MRRMLSFSFFQKKMKLNPILTTSLYQECMHNKKASSLIVGGKCAMNADFLTTSAVVLA